MEACWEPGPCQGQVEVRPEARDRAPGGSSDSVAMGVGRLWGERSLVWDELVTTARGGKSYTETFVVC